MCNLYSITTNQEAIRALFRKVNRYVGNLAPMSSVFPDYPAPVIRNTDAGTKMVTMRWGMPPPPRTGGPPVTNIRNPSSPHWRMWLKPENRCLVPANSFAEYAPEPNPGTKKKDVVWCALNEDRPLFAFAGIWTTFNGERGEVQAEVGVTGWAALWLLQLAAPVLMMLDGEVGSTVRADAAMAMMLRFRLSEIIFGREWKLLRRCGDRRRDIGLGARHR